MTNYLGAGYKPCPFGFFKEKEMKILNSGAAKIKFIAGGRSIELEKGASIELDSKTYSVLQKLFGCLVEVKEEKEVIIEAEPEPIINEEKKPAKRKSKGKK